MAVIVNTLFAMWFGSHFQLQKQATPTVRLGRNMID